MRKLLLLAGLSIVSGASCADTVSDIMSLQSRMKEIEVRMSLIERDLSDLKESKMPSVPLAQSNLPSNQVLIWTMQGIEQIYTYNYKNFPDVLTAIRHYFTAQGYESYMKALDESKNLNTVQDKRLTVTAKVSEKGKIIKEGAVNGIYTWEVQVPIDVNYKSSSESIDQKLVANVEVVRVPLSDSQVGIAIHSITATIASAEKPAATTTTTTTTTTTPDATKK